MVVETIDQREVTSNAVLEEIRRRGDDLTDAEEIARALERSQIDPQTTLWTIWRLIDENRLFLDSEGRLLLKKTVRTSV